MSWKASAFVKEITKNITQSEKLVLLVLADYHHTKHQAAWPSVPLLAEECLVTERAMFRILARLRDKGFITINPTKGRRNEYSFVGLDTPDPMSSLPLTESVFTPDRTPDPPAHAIRNEPVLELKATGTSPTSLESEIKSSKKQDPRYREFVEVLDRGYKAKKWPFGFEGGDGRQLKELLKLRPQWTVEDFLKALRNYFKSEGVVPGDLPRRYLTRLPTYTSGPLDRFGKAAKAADRIASIEEVNRVYEQ